MRFAIFALLAFLVALGRPNTSWAADNKIGVLITATAEDPVGRQLLFYLRDDVRGSATLREATNKNDALFTIAIVTMDPSSNRNGNSTVYSYSLLLANDNGLDHYYTSFVGICSAEVVPSCAQKLYGAIGQELEHLRQQLQRPNT